MVPEHDVTRPPWRWISRPTLVRSLLTTKGIVRHHVMPLARTASDSLKRRQRDSGSVSEVSVEQHPVSTECEAGSSTAHGRGEAVASGGGLFHGLHQEEGDRWCVGHERERLSRSTRQRCAWSISGVTVRRTVHEQTSQLNLDCVVQRLAASVEEECQLNLVVNEPSGAVCAYGRTRWRVKET